MQLQSKGERKKKKNFKTEWKKGWKEEEEKWNKTKLKLKQKKSIPLLQLKVTQNKLKWHTSIQIEYYMQHNVLVVQ